MPRCPSILNPMSDPNSKLVILLAKQAKKAGISLSLSKPVPVNQSYLLASQIADMNAAGIPWAFVKSPGPATVHAALRRRQEWIELWRTPVKPIKAPSRDYNELRGSLPALHRARKPA